ncbi:hypothetical protein [Bradyrhizobium sp. 170]|uniref:hypothetical protein n=1 Tax=Bradyrhizobium sp. 170 TaxID=2782641 RepID=UPI001FFF1217|nr:hypothetical protein [Bradyrhizobium sp. 170]UPK01411.1 hypothetical protein IVB05_27515 [Bradyrhizobium sp. 170]
MPEVGTSDLTATHVVFGSFPFLPERPRFNGNRYRTLEHVGASLGDSGSTETNVQGSPQNVENLPVERRGKSSLGLLILAVEFGIAVARLRSR